jgi:hypothetical protein
MYACERVHYKGTHGDPAVGMLLCNYFQSSILACPHHVSPMRVHASYATRAGLLGGATDLSGDGLEAQAAQLQADCANTNPCLGTTSSGVPRNSINQLVGGFTAANSTARDELCGNLTSGLLFQCYCVYVRPLPRGIAACALSVRPLPRDCYTCAHLSAGATLIVCVCVCVCVCSSLTPHPHRRPRALNCQSQGNGLIALAKGQV